MNCNAKLRSNYFTVDVSVLANVFCQLYNFARNKKKRQVLVFGKNDSCSLSNFLQTQIFLNFDHISRTYNQINNRDI